MEWGGYNNLYCCVFQLLPTRVLLVSLSKTRLLYVYSPTTNHHPKLQAVYRELEDPSPATATATADTVSSGFYSGPPRASAVAPAAAAAPTAATAPVAAAVPLWRIPVKTTQPSGSGGYSSGFYAGPPASAVAPASSASAARMAAIARAPAPMATAAREATVESIVAA